MPKTLKLEVENESGGQYALAVQDGASEDKKLCANGLVLIKDIVAALLHWQAGF